MSVAARVSTLLCALLTSAFTVAAGAARTAKSGVAVRVRRGELTRVEIPVDPGIR